MPVSEAYFPRKVEAGWIIRGLASMAYRYHQDLQPALIGDWRLHRIGGRPDIDYWVNRIQEFEAGEQFDPLEMQAVKQALAPLRG